MNYFQVPRISNSALSCIDPETGGHPEKYRDFMDGKFTQHSPAMNLGDLIHRRLLLNEELVAFTNMPAEAVKSIVETYMKQQSEQHNKVFKLDSDKELLLKIIRSYGYYNNRKDDTIVEHVIKEGSDYCDFLLSNQSKAVISSEWLLIIESINANTIKKPSLDLLHPEKRKSIEVLTEREIYFKVATLDYLSEPQIFECKAKIDRLIIDHEKRVYKLLDVKSTSSSLEQFPLSVEKYKYYRQMAFYVHACRQIVPSGYTLDGVYLLATETTNYCRSRLFKLEDTYLEKGERDWKSLLRRVSYHQATNNWIDSWEELYNKGVYPLSDRKSQIDFKQSPLLPASANFNKSKNPDQSSRMIFNQFEEGKLI